MAALHRFVFLQVQFQSMEMIGIGHTLSLIHILLCRAVQSGKQAVRTQSEKYVLGDTFNNSTLYKKTDTDAGSNVSDREARSDAEKTSGEAHT